MADKNSGAIGAIKTIIGILKGSLSSKTPLQTIPTATILAGAPFREGMSAVDVASKIIQRKKDLGIPLGPLPSGGDNLDLMMETIRVEEITNAILTKLKVEVAIPPGIPVTVTGTAGPGLPVVGQGLSTGIVKGQGIAR